MHTVNRMHTIGTGETDKEDYLDYMEQGTLFATNPENKNISKPSSSNTTYTPALEVELKICGIPVTFTVDTAASITVIPEVVYSKLLSSVSLGSSGVTLKSDSGNNIPVLGCMQVTVEYEGGVWKLPLVVVSGNKVALLGRDWLKHIQLNWHEMFNVRNITPEVEQVLRKHEQVFKACGSEDKIQHHQAEISVMPESTPVFCKARPVPYAQLEEVSKELDRLEARGVI